MCDTSQKAREESILIRRVRSTILSAGKESRKIWIEKCSFHEHDMEVIGDYKLLF